MKIEVETISDACRTCPDLKIDIVNVFAYDEVYAREYRCSNLETCRQAIRRSATKKEECNGSKI